MLKTLRRFYPVTAFLAGFVWDALTLGQRVRALDLWRLGAFLFGAGILLLWLAYREHRHLTAPDDTRTHASPLASLRWQAPYLLLQFFFGGIFSALFILYFKSSGHLGTFITTAILGTLLVGNEFAGKRYGHRFTLLWALFALNAILLANFALPMALGSIEARWFFVSTALGIALAHGLHLLSPGRPGRIAPAWAIAGLLVLASVTNLIAPVPLVNQGLAVGHAPTVRDNPFSVAVEAPAKWQFWRDQSATVHLAPGERLYAVSAVFAPFGVSAVLAHRWEKREADGWRPVYRNEFRSTGGRERGFRGYSWVVQPTPGEWRFTVETQDGRTIGAIDVTVSTADVLPAALVVREF